MLFKSNPKTVEQYASMFNKLYKLYSDFINSEDAFIILSKWASIPEFPLQHIEIDIDFYIKNIIENYKKNDRIESILKNIRAVNCFRLIKSCKTYLMHFPDLKKVEILKDYCEKTFIDYLNKNEHLNSEEDNISPLDFMEYHNAIDHYLTLGKNNRKYKPLLDYSWANKSIGKIYYDLENLTIEIDNKIDNQFNIDEYKYAEKQRNPEKIYLKLANGYSWWLLEGNNHPFESFIGSRPFGKRNHCGGDNTADVFFSLRYVDKDLDPSGILVSEATFACKRFKTNNKKTPYIYVLGQAKGSANNPLPPKLWVYAMELLVRPEFVSYFHGPYNRESDFSPYWLQNKYLYDEDYSDKLTDNLDFKISKDDWNDFKLLADKFFKLKPYWEDLFGALVKYNVSEAFELFQPKDWGAEKLIIEEDGIALEYYNLPDLFRGISNYWGRKGGELEKLGDNLDDYWSDYSQPYSEIDEKEYLIKIEEVNEPIYKIVKQCMENTGLSIFEAYEEDIDAPCEQILKWVGEAIIMANDTGYDVGEQNARFEAYEKFYDEFEFEDIYNYPIGKIVEKKNMWYVIIYKQTFLDLGFETRFFVSDNAIDANKGRYRIEWYGDFDEESCLERLKEELPSLENIKKILK